jgi:predicted negative regulator of RcsB-dependent stress response
MSMKSFNKFIKSNMVVLIVLIIVLALGLGLGLGLRKRTTSTTTTTTKGRSFQDLVDDITDGIDDANDTLTPFQELL